MPSIKGTASVADARERSKTLKSTKFPANFSKKVKLAKISIPVMTQWIEQKITSILGFDDEIVTSMAVNLFLPSDGTTPDPKRAQLDLVGFLGGEGAALLAKELWTLMVEAQEGASGIPRTLLEEKKKEIAEQKLQRQVDPPPGLAGNLGMNRYVDEAHRRAAEVRHLVPPAPQASAVGPVPIPNSPNRDSSDPPGGDYHSNRPDRFDRKRKLESGKERDRKMPARGDNLRPRNDGLPPQGRHPAALPPPPYPRDVDDRHFGPAHVPPRGRRDPGIQHRNSRERSLERGPPGRFAPPPSEDEFHRTNNWRRDDPHDPPPPFRHPDERGRWDEGRGRRRSQSDTEEMEELERRLLDLKNRAGKRGENKVLDDEIDKIEDRLYDLDRRMRRRLREEEEYRRRKRDDPALRNRSMERRGVAMGKPPPERHGGDRSESEDSRSASSHSSSSSRSSYTGSSQSSVSSYHRHSRRRGRSRSRSSKGSSRSSSPDERRR